MVPLGAAAPPLAQQIDRYVGVSLRQYHRGVERVLECEVPNIAEHVSKGLAGAVYGIMLILLIYLMPSGLAGLVRLVVMRFAKAAR